MLQSMNCFNVMYFNPWRMKDCIFSHFIKTYFSLSSAATLPVLSADQLFQMHTLKFDFRFLKKNISIVLVTSNLKFRIIIILICFLLFFLCFFRSHNVRWFWFCFFSQETNLEHKFTHESWKLISVWYNYSTDLS